MGGGGGGGLLWLSQANMAKEGDVLSLYSHGGTVKLFYITILPTRVCIKKTENNN